MASSASVFHRCDNNVGRLVHELICDHIQRHTGHSTNKWGTVSRFLQHKGQKYSFGHCHNRSRSTVQILPWIISQMNTLHLDGAQTCQISVGNDDSKLPSNCML
jgi:hypothetical protein